jgi:hypothetical protein
MDVNQCTRKCVFWNVLKRRGAMCPCTSTGIGTGIVIGIGTGIGTGTCGKPEDDKAWHVLRVKMRCKSNTRGQKTTQNA